MVYGDDGDNNGGGSVILLCSLRGYTKTRGILSDKTLSLDVDFIWILFFVYLIIKFDT